MKRISIVLIIITSAAFAFADDNTGSSGITDLFAGDTPGQYVYYHDRRGNNNALLGILKFNKTEYVARRFDMNTGAEVNVQFTAVDNNGEYEINLIKIFSGDQAAAMALIVDLSNMAGQYREFRGRKLEEETLTDPWPEFGYTLRHTFKSWIPFFRLYATEMEGSSASSFSLLYVGRMHDKNDLVFFKLKGILRTEKYGGFNVAPAGDAIKFSHGMFTVTLDANWEPVPSGNDIYKSYWLKKKGTRDSVVAIEVIPKGMFRDDPVTLVYRSICFSTLVIPSTVKIVKDSRGIMVSYTVLDPGNLYETYMYSYYMNDSSGNMNIFHFSAFSDVYDANREYFDGIIKGITVNPR